MINRARALRLAAACGLALLAAAGCTAGPAPSAAQPKDASQASATPPGQALVVSGQPGYGTAGFPPPDGAAQYAYARESSCPDGNQVPRHGLRVQARWRYQGQTARLSGVQVSFDEQSGSLAIPFLTIELTGSGTAGQWVTSMIEGNRVTGYHTTGWVPLRGTEAVPAESPLPEVRAQIWAGDPDTALIYCAAATGLFLVEGSTYGDSAH
jgi:hypothetical protein